MVKLYFKPESFEKYKRGEMCTAYTLRIFETDIEFEVDESQIRYSNGGIYAYIDK